MKYKYFFFDMDKTVTPARSPILPAMHSLLSSLPGEVIIVSGGEITRIGEQMQGVGHYHLGVSGNHAVHHQTQTVLWQNPSLTSSHQVEILAHIEQVKSLIEHEINEEWVPIEDRGPQISFSPLGNIAPSHLKHAYDPDRSKRLGWLEKIPFLSEELVVKIGGSTTFDYFHKDHHKGANVARLIAEQGWNKDEAIYFGDGLYPGGNDETVLGVIDAVLVRDENDTYDKIRSLLG